MKTYQGLITSLKENEIFCFTSNLQGFHGAGSAGYASFGVSGNRWREFNYDKLPNGWRGKWNIKGVNEGFQQGTDGWSYAIPTVTRPGQKRSIPSAQIESSIKTFYEEASHFSHFKFFVAQGIEDGLSGYTAREMAAMFSCAPIPPNVFFQEDFAKLLTI